MPSHSTQGRARASYQGFASHTSIKLPGDRDILGGLSSTPLQTILSLSTQSSDQEVKITDLHYVGSYNWVDGTTPTIVVPGSPLQWSNRTPPYQVHADDTEILFKDQNGYRCPNSILLPLLTSVNHVSMQNKEEFDWASTDFVTDRNNLRKLLRWINGTANDFRIDTQLAGKTILLNQWEKRYQEPRFWTTYGFNFEKASTRAAPGCENSTGHNRIVQYNMNGINLVVRFGVDACLSEARQSTASSSGDDLDDIIGALSGVSLRRAAPYNNTTEDLKTFPTITVISGGSIISQSSIIELTTRSLKSASDFEWDEYYPQLFLSQIPHYFIAVHQRGLFKEVIKRKLGSPELKKVAQESQKDLKKLRRLLHQITELVKKHGERGRLSLVCQNGELKVYERTNQASCLPDEVLRSFDP